MTISRDDCCLYAAGECTYRIHTTLEAEARPESKPWKKKDLFTSSSHIRLSKWEYLLLELSVFV